MASSSNSDLRLLEHLLDGLRDVKDPDMVETAVVFSELYRKLSEAEDEPEGNRAALNELLDNPRMFAAAKVGVTLSALRFLQAELAKLRETKRERELTEFEQAYARQCLAPILQSLASWFGGENKPQS